MAKIVVVTSGKGGVGKTTTSASFASGLALAGKKTAVIDFDVGLRNLALIMTKLAVRRGNYLRKYVYAFIESFAPTLTRAVVEKALGDEAKGSHYEI